MFHQRFRPFRCIKYCKWQCFVLILFRNPPPHGGPLAWFLAWKLKCYRNLLRQIWEVVDLSALMERKEWQEMNRKLMGSQIKWIRNERKWNDANSLWRNEQERHRKWIYMIQPPLVPPHPPKGGIRHTYATMYRYNYMFVLIYVCMPVCLSVCWWVM